MRRQVWMLTMVLLLALAGACSQDEKTSAAADAGSPPAPAAQSQAATAQAPHQMTPEQLGELGAQIRKEPTRADALLSQHGLTKESFEAQIRKVTEDPEASKRYAEAYRKANA